MKFNEITKIINLTYVKIICKVIIIGTILFRARYLDKTYFELDYDRLYIFSLL